MTFGSLLDYREQFISIRLSDYTKVFQKEGRALKRSRRAGGWRNRSKRSGGKGEQQRRAENEREKRRRSEGELEEKEERRRSRRGEAWADRGASAAVSWTGSRCSETGGSRIVRLTDAFMRWKIIYLVLFPFFCI